MKPSVLGSFMARKVSPFLTVEVQGGTWSVKDLPGLLVGDRVMCLPTPDGRHVFVKPEASGTLHGIWADAVAHDDFGFAGRSPIIGQSLAGVLPSAADDRSASGQGVPPAHAGCGSRLAGQACPCCRVQPHASGE